MANQRPIRRGRIPFRRGGRWRGLSKALHPVRWLDANSVKGASPEAPCGVSPIYLACDPLASPYELLVGDLDWDWTDASEVRIDRLVGTMSWTYSYANDSLTAPVLPLILRFGILATEETDRVYQTIDLFDPEALEEFQWMWIEQRTANGGDSGIIRGGADDFRMYTGAVDIPLDIRTRRKLGKKDSVILYAQTKLVAPAPTGYTVSSALSPMLRAIIRS